MAIFKAPTTINTQEVLISTNLGINTAFAFANTVSNSSAIVVAGNSSVQFTFLEVVVGETSNNVQFPDTYTVTSNVSSVNEGGSVSFNISSAYYPSETLYWTVSGTAIADGDFSSPTSTVSVGGSVALVSGTGTVVLTLAQDILTEGAENFNFNVRTGSVAGPIVVFDTIAIQDTSNTVPTYSIAVNTASINEGASKSFIITTTNVPDGTVLYWSTETVTGTITSADFTDSSLTGSVTINSSSGTITRTAAADAFTEGAESFLLRLRTGSVSGTIVATSSTTSINDTSITFVFGGSVSGYSSGGGNPNVSTTLNTIDKFPFATDSNATDVGDLTVARSAAAAGQSSPASGYTSGGTIPFTGTIDTIDKFPFASNANATDVGNLTGRRSSASGQSSDISGYTSGGSVYDTTVIDKFPFASDGNATDVGDITAPTSNLSGQSSPTNGYTSGGRVGNGLVGTINRFPFSSDVNAIALSGVLFQARGYVAGQSSSVNGYVSGGLTPLTTSKDTIDKFPFASDTNATDVGNLTLVAHQMAGQSSTTNGYATGGRFPPTSLQLYRNFIQKFPFASDGNATDIGDITVARAQAVGQQN